MICYFSAGTWEYDNAAHAKGLKIYLKNDLDQIADGGDPQGNMTEEQFLNSCTDTAFASYALFTRILMHRDLRPGLIARCP